MTVPQRGCVVLAAFALLSGTCLSVRGGSAPSRDIGLVLAGGGAKGSYEIGVWQAICEAGIDRRIGAMSGTSVGSICAVLFSSIEDPAKCETIWTNTIARAFEVNIGSLLSEALRDKAGLDKYASDNGLMSKDALRRVIIANLDIWPPRNPITVYATATSVDTMKRKSFQLDNLNRTNMIERVIASSAVPIVFSDQQICGERHLDGYLSDNHPVAPIIENDSGNSIKTVIVVYLSESPAERVTQKDVGSRNLIEIIPSSPCISMNIGNLDIASIDNNPATVRKLIELGRRDAEAVLKKEGLWTKTGLR